MQEVFSYVQGPLRFHTFTVKEKKEMEEVWRDAHKNETVRFRIGETYGSVDWFTGGTGFYTVTDRDRDTLVLKEAHDEADGFHQCEGDSSYSIHEEDGEEYIVLGSYHGHEDRIYAGRQAFCQAACNA